MQNFIFLRINKTLIFLGIELASNLDLLESCACLNTHNFATGWVHLM